MATSLTPGVYNCKVRVMSLRVFVLFFVLLVAGSRYGRARPGMAHPGPKTTSAPQRGEQYRTIVTQYCVSCHNERTKTAGLMFDRMDFTNVAAGAEIWEKAVRKLRVGMMPPQGAPQPDPAAREALVSWLTTELDSSAAAHPNSGQPLWRRLDRVESATAIRDTPALEI